MADSRPADGARREQPGAITRLRLDQAIRGHDDRAREVGEFALLVLPGATVIADEMQIGLQLGVGMRRQQFAMRVLIST